jgi:hypothetical protein
MYITETDVIFGDETMKWPRTFFLGSNVTWRMCTLDDASSYDPSYTGGSLG